MSRRTAGCLSPLFFTMASLVWGSPVAVADDLPPASGDTPYKQVSDEEPVKPEAKQSDKAVSPAGKIHVPAPQDSAKPKDKDADSKPAAGAPAKETAPKETAPKGTPAVGKSATVSKPKPTSRPAVEADPRRAVGTRA